VSRYTNPAQIRSELVRSLFDWWNAHRGDDIPDRADLDPNDLKKLLPNLLISDVEQDPLRIRYRLVGTKVAEATGLNFTGMYLDQLMPVDPEEPWMNDYRSAFATRQPIYGISTVQMPVGATYVYEFGIFPLRNGGSSIAQFLGIEDYFDFARLQADLEPWKVKS
jgi:hypothetical protein